MNKALFIQPRHPNAPVEGLGQVYMPTALLMAVARVKAVGGDVEFHDANIRQLPDLTSFDVVGMNTIGPSCIPSTLDLQQKILAQYPDIRFLQGGQVISSLDRVPYGDAPRFKRLFGNARNGNLDMNVMDALGVGQMALPTQTSLIPAYESLDDGLLKQYLSNPFSFFVAQGCKYACDFCSATRTRDDPVTGKSATISEMYRDINILKMDLEWLVGKAEQFGIPQLTMYMSNLDMCQTPEKLAQFAEVVGDVRRSHPSFGIKLTALSTVKEFKKMQENYASILHTMRSVGLTNLAFGVEGMADDKISKAYFANMRKGHNKAADCYHVIRDAAEVFGFTPEILLTPGHQQDNEGTLRTTVEYAEHMAENHPVVIRPYAAKVWLTGNDGWHNGQYDAQIERVLRNPALFQNLDINAFQSTLIEPDAEKRALVNKVFGRLCDLSRGAAPPLLPIEEGMSADELKVVVDYNTARYDH